jgi:hypothetical protein
VKGQIWDTGRYSYNSINFVVYSKQGKYYLAGQERYRAITSASVRVSSFSTASILHALPDYVSPFAHSLNLYSTDTTAGREEFSLYMISLNARPTSTL